MNQVINDKLCIWAWGKTDSTFDHTRDDDTIHLLPVLVEKGFDISLEHDSNGWILCYTKDSGGALCFIYKDGGYYPTISKAITSAILQLIESETK